ncbi:hypothetical protein Aperf_G00000112790 [Anoplocephala perfoliata]
MSSKSPDSSEKDEHESPALSLIFAGSSQEVKSGGPATEIYDRLERYGQISRNYTMMDITNDVLAHRNETVDTPFPHGRMPSHNDHFNHFSYAGHGAFSVVLRAKHRIDNKEYALKAIPNISKPRELIAAFREANTLTKLINPHVVRYYTCWVEPQKFSGSGLHDKNGFINLEQLLRYYEADEASEIFVEPAGVVGLPQSVASSQESSKYSNSRQCAQFSFEDSNFLSTNPMTLVIQMELCTSTLADWLSSRPSDLTKYQNEDGSLLVNPEYRRQVRWLFDQIVLGLVAIHESNIIHRDIKPVNIFIQGIGSSGPNAFFFKSGECSASEKSVHREEDNYHRLSVKIGDFGLSKVLGRPGSDDDQPIANGNQSALVRIKSSNRNTFLTSGVGTIFYVAPEVIAESGERWSKYNQQADIYSLGVVLLQMLYICKTKMELASYVDRDLTKPYDKSFLPPHLFEIWPVEAELLFKMLHPNPKERPSALSLKDHLASTSEVIIGDVKELRDLRTENEKLRKRISELEELIELSSGMEIGEKITPPITPYDE